MKIKTVGIIGDSLEKPELNKIAEEMGRKLASSGITVITGGRDGVMGAVSKGAGSVSNRPQTARVIGILPGIRKDEGNQHLDYAIPTGIGWARNQIVVLASDIVIAIGGGAGTLSEIAYAWAYNKPVLAFKNVEGWSDKLGGQKIDGKRSDSIIGVSSPDEAMDIINDIFSDLLR